jgi:hypothetical protein
LRRPPNISPAPFALPHACTLSDAHCTRHRISILHSSITLLINDSTDTTTKRETGRKAQLGNITAAKAVADVIRTTLGPRSMLKMILDPMGGK